MKILSLFNNKGGVGKTTLAYHTACALADMGKRVLMLDLDPQCNLTVFAMDEETLHEIWREEDDFITGFEESHKAMGQEKFQEFNSRPRTIHYLLKPTEEGTGELEELPPAVAVRPNLDIIPGRLTLHMYEYKISERWSGSYQGDPLSIRTITRIREIAKSYSEKNNYDFIMVDTSPSLGALNKVIISTVDGFIIPCMPDMFSMYGIRNIGSCLSQWKTELQTIYSLISDQKRKKFPKAFVQFLGYTIYNARRYANTPPWDLALAHYNYAKQIPETIQRFITPEVRIPIHDDVMQAPIGHMAVMHSHNTLPGMAQKYKHPIWDVPNCSELEPDDRRTIIGNRQMYLQMKQAYFAFANDLLGRVERLPND